MSVFPSIFSRLPLALVVAGVLLCVPDAAEAGWFWKKKTPPPLVVYTPQPGWQPTPPPQAQGWVQPVSAVPDARWSPPPQPQWTPPPAVRRPAPAPAGLLLNQMTQECLTLARRGLIYQFGSADPSRGGLDCSGTVQHVMGRLGQKFPRTASDQFLHLQKLGTFTTSPAGASAHWIFQNCKPGDLLFWRGTYNTGRWPDVSHVMIYLGVDRRDGKPKMFGASSRKSKGENGANVDIYEFKPVKAGGGSGQFLGFASIPGVNVPANQWVSR